MSDPIKLAWLNLAGIVVGLVGTIFMGWIGYLTVKLNRKADDAASAVKAVKTTLQDTTTETKESLDRIGIVAAATLHLVNSGTAAQLRLRVDEAKARVAADDSAANRILLATAERLFAEHMVNQAKADQAAGGAQKIVDAGSSLSKPEPTKGATL